MSINIKLAIALAIFLWASAFVGIRVALHAYSPEGLALLRYMVASICMGIVYFQMPNRSKMCIQDRIWLALVGVVGIGVYNITLNYGELTITSGMASFIISMSPIVTALFAVLFLGEKLNKYHVMGFLVSIAGVVLITAGTQHDLHWSTSLNYILIATVVGSCYTVFQKPFLAKYHAIEATTYVIWGGTLFLLIYYPKLLMDLHHASFMPTLTVVYLGVFPAAVGYLAWSYALSQIPASRAVTFLYFQPFIATLLGWTYLHEVPALFSIMGGLLAIVGVWLVNQSYKVKASAS